MDINRSALIVKLTTISSLFKKMVAIQEKMNLYAPKDCYKRKVKLPEFPCEQELTIDHQVENALEIAKNEYNKAYAPKNPKEKKEQFEEPKHTAEEKNKIVKYTFIRNIGLGGAIFFALGIFSALEYIGSLITILILALGSLGLFFYFKFQLKKLMNVLEERKKEALVKFEEKKKQNKQDFEQKLRDYEKAAEDHKLELDKFLEQYSAWRDIYLKQLEEEKEIKAKLEGDRIAGVEKIRETELVPLANQLAQINDRVSNDYLPVLDEIINLLIDGRAEDYKEAVNLYEEIVYRERQLELQREQERERRIEEERRHHQEDQFRREQINALRRSNCANYSKYSCMYSDCSTCSIYRQK